MPLNFEPKKSSEWIQLYEDTRGISDAYRHEYDADYGLLYQLYHSFVDMSSRDPERNNPFLPETFVAIEQQVPQHVKALFSTPPIFPIKPTNPLRKDYARAYQRLLEYFVNGAWDKSTPIIGVAEKLIKMKKLFGMALLEDYWDYSYQTVESEEPIMEQGIRVGMEKTSDKQLRGRWNWKVFAPWMSGVDPSHECIEAMAWFYLEEPTRKSTLIQHMQEFPKQYNKAKVEDVKKTNASNIFTLKLRQQMGFKENEEDDDMGLKTRLWLPTRGKMVEIWNGQTVLRVIDAKPRLTRWIAVDDPYLNCFYAHTPVKPAAMIQVMINAIFGSYLDALDRTSDPVMGYEAQMIDPNSIVSGLVEVNPAALKNGKSISDIVQRIDTGQVDPNVKDALEMLVNANQKAYAQSDYTQGNIPSIRAESATAVRAVKDAGQARIDHEASRDEKTAKTKMFINGVDLINLHMDEEEMQEVLGDDYQFIALYPDIRKLPGGFSLDYKGADDIAEKDAKFERRMIKFEKLQGFIPQPQVIAKDIMKNDDDFEEKVIEEAFTAAPVQPGAVDPLTGQPMQPAMPGAQGQPSPQGNPMAMNPTQQGQAA